MLQPILIIFLLNCTVGVQADIYTAVADLENALEAHKTIKDYLELYIKRHEKRLAILKRYLVIIRREQKKAIADIPEYVENPINIFTLFKRLAVDLHYIKHSIEDETGYIDDITIKRYSKKYPTMEDLSGAAEGLIRLQYVYNLEAKELADGKLNGVVYSTPMTACDCYELGRALYNKKDFVNGLEWMLQAHRRYGEERIDNTFSRIDVIEHISFGHSKIGHMKNALHWIQKIIEIDPDNLRAKKIAQQCRNNLMDSRYGLWHSKMQEDRQLRQLLKDSHELVYNPLCRGEMVLPIKISSRLTCRYQTESHPFLKLAPYKTEMLYLNPDVVLFHEILSDSEIKTVLKKAKIKLYRSGIQLPENKASFSKQRISKSAWVNDEESNVVARISRRIKHITGMSLESSEHLQVANYGIGGYYSLHHDFFEHVPSTTEGNRVATVLFYLSNVTQGGATIFSRLGLSVFPVKGTAIYWENLHPSGERNHCMMHAACPVLIGSKWVATRWIHEIGQEFIKPCNLEYQKEGCFHNLPRPIFKTYKRKRPVVFNNFY